MTILVLREGEGMTIGIINVNTSPENVSTGLWLFYYRFWLTEEGRIDSWQMNTAILFAHLLGVFQ